MKKLQENFNKDCKDEKETNNISSPCLSPTKRKNSSENSGNELMPKKQKLTKNTSKNQKGIVGFFNKQNEPTKDSNSFKKSNISIKKVVLNDGIKTIPHNEIANDMTNCSPNKKERLSSENLEEKQNIKSETISTSSIVKKAKVEKKRKRLLKISDSDSEEDGFGTEKVVDVVKEEQDMVSSDNEIPPTPTTDIIKITSRKINPKKKKKIVDKTYTDEEGYILTRKEEVYEAGSDSEDNKNQDETNGKKIEQNINGGISETKEVNKTVSKKSKKKGSSPQKGKQATMMNFFKKIP
ncbi:hypothetical protein EVAR_3017_1 [Eumeta japonica]|uniref:DNA polymerase delta subunit 3 n=1 Tax=Eumeta variegata TaxID=151549 RepID=A0A4C1STQ3_EUMVA|nr:hypothetical protein EVAR_3017_1 [Eumeta japonica]